MNRQSEGTYTHQFLDMVKGIADFKLDVVTLHNLMQFVFIFIIIKVFLKMIWPWRPFFISMEPWLSGTMLLLLPMWISTWTHKYLKTLMVCVIRTQYTSPCINSSAGFKLREFWLPRNTCFWTLFLVHRGEERCSSYPRNTHGIYRTVFHVFIPCILWNSMEFYAVLCSSMQFYEILCIYK